MSERLTVTSDDIAAQPAAPPTLTIQTSDLPDERPPRPSGSRLTISASDLEALGTADDMNLAELEQAMLRLVITARRRYIPGWLPHKTLRWHPGAAAASRRHAAGMLAQQPGRPAPDSPPLSRRLDQAGVTFLACGENVGIISGPLCHGETGMVELQNAFMNQPRGITNHRGNILNPVWTHIGIGAAYDPQGRLVMAQTFITTLNNI